MKIQIGTKFRKYATGNKYVICVVSDIFDITSVSRLTGESTVRVSYYAKSENYCQGEGFEVSKTTILRGIIN